MDPLSFAKLLGEISPKAQSARSFTPLIHMFNLLKTHDISIDSSGGKARGLDSCPTVH